jgi:hypothetical protein
MLPLTTQQQQEACRTNPVWFWNNTILRAYNSTDGDMKPIPVGTIGCLWSVRDSRPGVRDYYVEFSGWERFYIEEESWTDFLEPCEGKDLYDKDNYDLLVEDRKFVFSAETTLAFSLPDNYRIVPAFTLGELIGVKADDQEQVTHYIVQFPEYGISKIGVPLYRRSFRSGRKEMTRKDDIVLATPIPYYSDLPIRCQDGTVVPAMTVGLHTGYIKYNYSQRQMYWVEYLGYGKALINDSEWSDHFWREPEPGATPYFAEDCGSTGEEELPHQSTRHLR